MENIFEVLLFLFFIVLTGLSAASKKAKEKRGDFESAPEETVFPTSTHPKAPPQPSQQEPAKPAPVSTEPAWSRMLRDMLELEQPEPEPVFEPPVQQKDRTKKLIRKNKQQNPSNKIPETKPAGRPILQALPPLPTGSRPIPNPLTEILSRAKEEPMRTAIILSEIIQPPRAKRKAIR